MPFGKPKIKVSLKAQTPSKLDHKALKTQLETVGLSCSQLTPQFLTNSIANVQSQIPSGSIASFGIYAPSTGPAAAAMETKPELICHSNLAATVGTYVQAAKTSWEPSATGDGFSGNLEVIQHPGHFDYLYKNKGDNGFTGTKMPQATYGGNYENATAIEKLFVKVCTDASSVVVKGIDEAAMSATLTRIIAPLGDKNISDYHSADSRVIYLVDGYNESTGEVDGIGVVTVSWDLTIHEYKRKSKDGGDTHPTSLVINASSVMYSDPSVLCQNYHAVLKQFKIDPANAPSCDF